MYTYGTYGQCLKTTGTVAERNPMRYSSEYYDNELGMIYYNYRHYNPLDGRWLSRDPMEEQGGTNLYGFCSNDPMSKIDQLGLSDLPGASSTGLSTHWGNIVREKKPWATVCYKYYQKALSEEDVWRFLAKANRLNYEEREKWVKGYKPLPEPGDLFLVPNTFVVYTTKLSFLDSYRYQPVNTARIKLQEISLRFLLSGVRVEEYLNEEDRKLFCNLWKTKGIFGFGFSGHGAFDENNNCYAGFCTTLDVDHDQPVMPTEVEPEYKLAFIAAFSCGAEDVGWGRTGKRTPVNNFDNKLDYPLSNDGVYVAYYGRYTIGKDSVFFTKLNQYTFGVFG